MSAPSQGWIPCSEKFPPMDTMVIVSGGTARYLGRRHCAEHYWLSTQSNREIEWPVTHWMPFPDPPPPPPKVELKYDERLTTIVKLTEPVYDAIGSRYGREVADGWDRITQALAQPPGSTYFKREREVKK